MEKNSFLNTKTKTKIRLYGRQYRVGTTGVCMGTLVPQPTWYGPTYRNGEGTGGTYNTDYKQYPPHIG